MNELLWHCRYKARPVSCLEKRSIGAWRPLTHFLSFRRAIIQAQSHGDWHKDVALGHWRQCDKAADAWRHAGACIGDSWKLKAARGAEFFPKEMPMCSHAAAA